MLNVNGLNVMNSFFGDDGHDKGFGPMLTVMDENGDNQKIIRVPRNKLPLNLNHTSDHMNNKISISIPIIDSDKSKVLHLAEKELQSVFVTIPLSFNAVRVNSLENLIRNINLLVEDKNIYQWDQTTYMLYLNEILGQRFKYFYEKFFKKFQHHDEIVLPILFSPTLKPWYLNKNIKLDIVFNNFEHIFEQTESFEQIHFDKITCVGWYLVQNDLNFFDRKYQDQNFIERPVQISGTNFMKLKHDGRTHLNHDLLDKNCHKKLIFDFNNQLFNDGKVFYGRTVDQSIKNYLASCVKPTNTLKESCFFSIHTGRFQQNNSDAWDKWKLIKNSKFSTTLIYENTYKTIIYTKNQEIDDFPDFFFDLMANINLPIYWFSHICLDFSNYCSVLDSFDENVKEENCYKLLEKGFFVDLSKKVCFNGVSSYKFNKVLNVEYVSARYEKSKYLNSEHFAVAFSLPVESAKPSLFSLYHFPKIYKKNYRWKDLDMRYPFEISELIFVSKKLLNQEKVVSKNILKTSSSMCERPNEFPMFCMLDEFNGVDGYFALDQYDMFLEMRDPYFEKLMDHVSMRILSFTFNSLIYHKGTINIYQENFLIRHSHTPAVVDLLIENDLMSDQCPSKRYKLN